MVSQTAGKRFGDYLTVGEAAQFLGVSPWTLRNWDKAGRLTPRRHPKNGYRIYLREELSAVLQMDSRNGQQSNLAAPRIDWSDMGESDHFVQFYESDEFLINSVAGFVGAALRDGGNAIIVATEDHRQGIQKALMAQKLDFAPEQFVVLDAAQTLARFMVNGWPDAQRVRESLGPIVARLTQSGRRLHIFGEMVALLWAGDNRAAAVELEKIWSDMAQGNKFALFCAYPLNGFTLGDDGEPFAEICSCHSRIIPAESYSAVASARERLHSVAVLQQKASSLEAEIAHRKEVEQALVRRERELSDFFENAVEGLHQVGPDGTILWANKAELKLLGYEAHEYIGQPIARFHIDQDVIETMLSKLLRGECLYDQPARLRCKDGSIKHVLIHSNSYFEDGKFIHTRCFTRDITERVQTEIRQRELLEAEHAARMEAERVSRMKDEFLATLSHEVRTPLSAIFGWTQIIKKTPDNLKTVSHGISVIDRNVRVQTRLIEDLLDMSRIISGKVRLDVQQTDLIPVLEAAVEAVRPTAETKGIHIAQVLDPLAGPVNGDANRLQQVVWNLLTNAVKFTPTGGTIELLLERVNSHIQITVSDTGAGIKPEFLPHVFERFRQADSSSTRKFGGLGLGLSIVKQLVELHGGSVRAKSAGEGRGASFTITLPVMAAKLSELQQQPPAADRQLVIDCSAIQLQRLKILVVDDELDARQLIARLLQDRGAQVITATSADEAMELLKTLQPDMLISDIGMPGKDGYQFIREIRAKPQSQGGQISAVALTAFARSEDRTRAMLAGYQAYLSKPVEAEELVVTVASLAGRTGR